MDKNEQKHFKVVYGKIFGIPIGSATPITDEGNRVFTKYFIPFFISCGAGIFSNKLTSNPSLSTLIFIVGICIAFFTAYLFIRQLKHTATFERQYFFKKNNKNE